MAERTKRIRIVSALAVALAASGCADEQEALIVLHSPAWNEDGACVADPSTDAALALGLLDVAPQTPYMLPVILRNQLVPQDPNSTNSGIDNGEMQLRSADVSLSMPQAPEIIDQLEARDPALVDFSWPLPTDSLAPGEEQGVLLEVISRAAAQALSESLASLDPGARPILEVHIVFHARRTGNAVGKVGEVEAREYTFPIQLCSGCLRTCETCANGQCPIDPAGVVGGVCGNAQDLPYAPVGCENPLDAQGG